MPMNKVSLRLVGNEMPGRSANAPPIGQLADIDIPSPDNSKTYACTDQVSLRITPHPTNGGFLLDFVHPSNGARIGKPGFTVWNMMQPVRQLYPIGGDSNKKVDVEVYSLYPNYNYELRTATGDQVVRKMTFRYYLELMDP